MSITATTEEKKALQNMLIANIDRFRIAKTRKGRLGTVKGETWDIVNTECPKSLPHIEAHVFYLCNLFFGYNLLFLGVN